MNSSVGWQARRGWIYFKLKAASLSSAHRDKGSTLLISAAETQGFGREGSGPFHPTRISENGFFPPFSISKCVTLICAYRIISPAANEKLYALDVMRKDRGWSKTVLGDTDEREEDHI